MPMRSDHLDEIHRAECELYDHPWTLGNLRDAIDAGYDCFEYRRASQLIGYSVMMIALDEAHLLNFSIAKPFHRQGIGRSLLMEICDIARSKSAVAMLLEVRPSNSAARSLYAAAGFIEIGVRRDYYPSIHGREDALVLRRYL